MGYSKIFLVVSLCLVSYLMMNVNDKTNQTYEGNKIDSTATTFLIYSDALDDFITANKTFQGDATKNIVIPTWLGKISTITTYASNGTGYVFIPNQPGLFSKLQEKTGNSSQLGRSDSSSIVTPSGAISKPAYIPNNQVVYIR